MTLSSVEAALARRVALFDGLPLRSLPRPYVATAEEERDAAETAEAVVEALEVVARRYLDDADLRRALALPAPIERLILDVDPGYARACPIARCDGHRVNGRFVVIETNTDGTAGIHDHDSVDEAVTEVSPEAIAGLRRAGPADGKDVRDRILDAILACRAEARPGAAPPSVAIVDWREEKTVYEFHALALRLVRRGHAARFVDVRDLALDGDRLLGGKGGDPVDLVYRRVIGMDLVARADEAATFMEAYRRGAAVFAGSLRSEVGWTKGVLAVLTDPDLNAFLPPALRRRLDGRIAETRFLTPDVAERIRGARGEWVLKPQWANGARGLVVGAHVDQARWEEALRACVADRYVAQRHQPPEVREIEGAGPLHMNLSPFVFGGRYAGLYVRGHARPVVHLSGGAYTLSAWVREGQ